MKWEKMAQAAIGLYLILPGPEDAITGGASVLPSAALGTLLLADAFGIRL